MMNLNNIQKVIDLEKKLKTTDEITYNKYYTYIHEIIGDYYYHTDEYEKAKSYYLVAAVNINSILSLYRQAEIYNNEAKKILASKKTDNKFKIFSNAVKEKIKYFQQNVENREFQSTEELLSLGNLYSIIEEHKDYKKSIKYHNRFLCLEKNLYNYDIINEIINNIIEFYEQLVKKHNNLEASLILGKWYSDPPNVRIEKKYVEAIKFYKQAAENHHNLEAALILGEWYSKRPDIVEQNYSEAIKFYKQAAENHHNPEASFILGEWYCEHPDILPLDYSEAIKFYEKAAPKHPQALMRLGALYSGHYGAKIKDDEKANYYYNVFLRQNSNNSAIAIQQILNDVASDVNLSPLTLSHSYIQVGLAHDIDAREPIDLIPIIEGIVNLFNKSFMTPLYNSQSQNQSLTSSSSSILMHQNGEPLKFYRAVTKKDIDIIEEQLIPKVGVYLKAKVYTDPKNRNTGFRMEIEDDKRCIEVQENYRASNTTIACIHWSQGVFDNFKSDQNIYVYLNMQLALQHSLKFQIKVSLDNNIFKLPTEQFKSQLPVSGICMRSLQGLCI